MTTSDLKFQFPHKEYEIVPMLLSDAPRAQLMMQENDRALEDYLSHLSTDGGGGSLYTFHAGGESYSGYTVSNGTPHVRSLDDDIGATVVLPDGTGAIKVTNIILFYPTSTDSVNLEGYLNLDSDNAMLETTIDTGGTDDFYTLTTQAVFDTSTHTSVHGNLQLNVINNASQDIFVYDVTWIIEFTNFGGTIVPDPH